MPAVAVLLIGALFALAWVLATSGIMEQISQSLASTLPPLPVITWQQIFAKIGSWFSGVGTWATSHVVPLWQGLWAYHDSSYQSIRAQRRIAASNFAAHARTKTVTIPAAVADEAKRRTLMGKDLWNADVGLAEGVQSTALNAVTTERLDRIAAAAALWDSDVGLAERVQSTALNAVALEEAARIAGDVALWDSAVGLDEQVQAAALGAVSIESDSRIAADETLQIDLNNQGAAFQQQLGQGLAGLQALLGGQIAANAVSQAAATGAVAQAVTALENSECIKFCDPLGALGQALQLLDVAGIIAFLGYAASDPGGAQAFLQDTLAPGFQAAVGTVESMVGVGQAG